MRKTTTTLTTLVAAGALTALGIGLAPTAMAAVPGASATRATADASSTQELGREGHNPRGERPGLETIMTVLDVSRDELTAARKAGTTLAELAKQQGVEVSVLIDALVTDAEKHIAEHVADGTLTQEQADERLAEIEQRITDRVNGVEPAEGERPDRGERGPGGHGPHGPGAGVGADDES